MNSQNDLKTFAKPIPKPVPKPLSPGLLAKIEFEKAFKMKHPFEQLEVNIPFSKNLNRNSNISARRKTKLDRSSDLFLNVLTRTENQYRENIRILDY